MHDKIVLASNAAFQNLLVPALLYFENIWKDENLLDAKVEKMKLANGKYES